MKPVTHSGCSNNPGRQSFPSQHVNLCLFYQSDKFQLSRCRSCVHLLIHYCVFNLSIVHIKHCMVMYLIICFYVSCLVSVLAQHAWKHCHVLAGSVLIHRALGCVRLSHFSACLSLNNERERKPKLSKQHSLEVIYNPAKEFSLDKKSKVRSKKKLIN